MRSRFLLSVVVRRPVQSAALVLAGGLLGLTLVGLSAAIATVSAAVEISLRAEWGGRAFALQSSDPRVADRLMGLTDVAGVADDTADVTASGRTARLFIRSASDASLRLGTVVEGRRPSRTGEAILSEPVAAALGIRVGDDIRVSSGDSLRTVRISALGIDPADSSSEFLIELVDAASLRPTRWLSNTDFYQLPGVGPLLDQGAGSYQSFEALRSQVPQLNPESTSSLRYVPVMLAILMLLAMLVGTAALARTWVNDVVALQAAGMSQERAWRWMTRSAGALVAAGVLLGSALVMILLQRGAAQISRVLGQRWLEVERPYGALVTALSCVVLITTAAPLLVRTAPRMVAAIRTYRTEEPRRLSPKAGVFLVAVGLWASLVSTTDLAATPAENVLLVVMAAVVAALTPFIVADLCCTGLPPVRRKLTRHLLGSLRPIVAVACVVAMFTGIWTATTVYDANYGERLSGVEQPPGSLVLSEVTAPAAELLIDAYRASGGGEARQFGLPVEEGGAYRVTGTSVTECMEDVGAQKLADVPPQCLDIGSPLPINLIAAADDDGAGVRADPRLIDAQGNVSVVRFNGPTGEIVDIRRVAAEPDSELGGLLPGLILPSSSPAAADLAFTPRGADRVLFSGFSTLTPEEQIRFKSQALRVAPGAELADATSPSTYDRARGIADLVAVVGGAVVFLLLVVGGWTVMVAQQEARRAISGLSGRRRYVRSLAGRWAGCIAVSLVAVAGIVAVTSVGTRTAHDASHGFAWMTPTVLGIVASLLLGISFAATMRTARS